MDRNQYRQLIRSPSALKQEFEKVLANLSGDENAVAFVEAKWSLTRVWVVVTSRRMLLFERTMLSQTKNPESTIHGVELTNFQRV